MMRSSLVAPGVVIEVPAAADQQLTLAFAAVNHLDRAIADAEDEATDDLLWEQAGRVKVLLDSGLSQRQVAAGWINARTGQPYSHTHVQYVVEVFGKLTCQPRPRFRTEYQRVANPATTTAQRLVASDENEWYTPPEYIESARRVLGGIDLDPASSAEANEVVGAKCYYSIADDGLTAPWHGTVWLNPPYGGLAEAFVARLVGECTAGRVTAAVALLNAHATDTTWFQPLWDFTLCFTRGRIDFWAPEGRQKDTHSTHGSVFAYLGPDTAFFSREFSGWGAVVRRYVP